MFKLLGDHNESLKHYQQEYEIYAKVNDARNLYKTRSKIAELCMLLGLHIEALKHYEEQLVAAREFKDVKGQAHALWNLGANEVNLGNQKQAILYFNQQLLLIDEEAEKGAVTCAIGECHERLSNYNKAEECYKQCLKSAQISDDKILMEKAYHGLQSVSQQINDIIASVYYSKLRINVCEELQSTVLLAQTLEDLTKLHMQECNYHEAVNCAISLLELINDSEDLEAMKLEILMLAGKVNYKLHRYYRWEMRMIFVYTFIYDFFSVL